MFAAGVFYYFTTNQMKQFVKQRQNIFREDVWFLMQQAKPL